MRRLKKFNIGNLKNVAHSGNFFFNCITKLYKGGICYEYYYCIICISIHSNIQTQVNVLLVFE